MGPGQGQEHQRPDLPMYERSSEEQQRPGVMPAGRAHGEWSVSSGNTSHGRMCRKGTLALQLNQGAVASTQQKAMAPQTSAAATSDTPAQTELRWEHAAAAVPGWARLPCQHQRAAGGGVWDEGYQRDSERETAGILHSLP